ncbi:nuclear transport factor 2 family protein [Pseudonocardia acaciae]|uniref:nuclear transport factor 2 family protein n=1 Tax=Pseudonocardia acaciae TaxID=551276 RepID=UPI0006845502|nr:nuclear transport factor 2 family protein [Pseudonocardia acaciae]
MRSVHPFPAALVDGDIPAVTDMLAPDVVLYSPILSRYRFRGHDRVVPLLTAITEIVSDPEILEDFGDRERRLVAVRGRIRGTRIEVAALLTFDESAAVREIKIFARPLPGVAALMAALGPRLAHSTTAAALMTAVAVPFAAVAPVFDRAAERLVR